MSTHYALVSHGKVLGYTGALFPSDELPMGARVWHFIPMPAFEFVEPIIAELTAPPAIELVETVIPTQAEYLHSCSNGAPAYADDLLDEAARLHHFREVLERYESLDLELRDGVGRRVDTDTVTIVKQMVPAHALREYVEVVDPDEAQLVDTAEPCYLLMARQMKAASAA
ncbi:MAG TPA: hypothetical protein VGP25_06710 [Gemmatimonadaceae bacterium]|jgi:hypothetical protein|nr:hypothetical protein [Gemmatimonadaceae bacterium]